MTTTEARIYLIYRKFNCTCTIHASNYSRQRKKKQRKIDEKVSHSHRSAYN